MKGIKEMFDGLKERAVEWFYRPETPYPGPVFSGFAADIYFNGPRDLDEYK